MFFGFFFLFKIIQIQMSMQGENPAKIIESVQSVKRKSNIIIFSIIVAALIVIFVNTYVVINEETDPLIADEKKGIVLLTIQVLILGCIMTYGLYLLAYYVIMGLRFVQILSNQFPISKLRYWILSVFFSSLILVTFANTAQIYLAVPIAALLDKDICDEWFQDTAETLLIIAYLGPLLYGLIIIYIMNYFAEEQTTDGTLYYQDTPGDDGMSNTMSKF